MVSRVVPVQFSITNSPQAQGYLTDFNKVVNIKTKFTMPPDIDINQASGILSAIGANPLSLITDGVCSESSLGSPRKLQFIRSDGSSLSVPVDARENLREAANQIIGIIGTGGVKVSCIKLIGERYSNLNGDFNIVFNNQVAPSHRVASSSSKQAFYAGTTTYASDTDYEAGGGSYLVPVKVMTDIKGSPPSRLTSVWNNCAGQLGNAVGCGGKLSSQRKARRFILKFATAIENGQITESETSELPVKNLDVSACGQLLAGLNGLVCVAYRGEDYAKFHKSL